MNDERLRLRAKQAGIAVTWRDQAGEQRTVTPDVLRALLEALGAGYGGEQDAGEAPALLTLAAGRRVVLPLQHKGAGSQAQLSGVGLAPQDIAISASGAAMLPALAPGYYKLALRDNEVTLAAAPQRCPLLAEVLQDRPGWGVNTQIYALRAMDGGDIGHFGAVTELAGALAPWGADAIAISPVHALFGAAPDRCSPYSPSTRAHYNPLHADPALILPPALIGRALSRRPGLAQELAQDMARLPAATQVEWERAGPLRLRFFRALFDELDRGDASAARASFDGFAATASPSLLAHATFEALQACLVAADPAHADWRRWPAALRQLDGAAVVAFAHEHPDHIRFQVFLQWLTLRSAQAAQARCRAAGLRLGMIADLAIGVAPDGSHAWSRPGDLLNGLSIGAPPDYYSATGQSWGLAALSPQALKRNGYAPFLEALRAALAFSGGVRIDHAMGLSRLWLAPEGASAAEGAYLAMPCADLLRLLALECWRHGAVAIGEDLGTVAPEFRKAMAAHGVAGMRVLRFEQDEHGLIPPHAWDPAAIAMTSTHDQAPIAGWWSCADPLAAHDDARPAQRKALWRGFREAGVAHGAEPCPQDADMAADAAIAFVAATPAAAAFIAMEDLLALSRQPNVPGTTTEFPNWRLRLPVDAVQIGADPNVARRAAPLARRRQPAPEETPAAGRPHRRPP